MFSFYISSNKTRIDIACTCHFLLLQLLDTMSSALWGPWPMRTPSWRQAYAVFIWASYFSSSQHLVLVASRMPVLLRWAVTRAEGHLSGNTWEVTIAEWMPDDPACWGHSCATGPTAHQPALWAQPFEFKACLLADADGYCSRCQHDSSSSDVSLNTEKTKDLNSG